jgi:hypothetical protein
MPACAFLLYDPFLFYLAAFPACMSGGIIATPAGTVI